ncbi:MaoC family dehydratase [Streptomyces hirsutus]
MAEPRIFTSVDDLKAAVGEPLGTRTGWRSTRNGIDLFAEATGDHQWMPLSIRSGPRRARSARPSRTAI